MNPKGWIFDLDGTLHLAIHDFSSMKAELGLPAELPLMEGLLAAPEAQRPGLWARVAAWEHGLAERAVAAPDALRLLQALAGAGRRVGVLTRNTREAALRAMAVSGLDAYFDPSDVLGRDCARAKPDPEGLFVLLGRWGLQPSEAVMLGDGLADVQAARAAGVIAIGLSREEPQDFGAEADWVVPALDHALRLPGWRL